MCVFTRSLLSTASDKCGVESECLSFTEYVAAAQSLWETERIQSSGSNGGDAVHMVVTSESRQIFQQHNSYEATTRNVNNHSAVRPLFLWNHRDVAQDTGYLEHVLASNNFTADEMMVSALSSLRAQLQTRVTMGNCCSNFHLVLKDLLDAGCGATATSHFQCLQDHADPAFRICCSWDKTPRCQMRRTQLQQQSLL